MTDLQELIEEVFCSALEIESEADRNGYVEERCAGNDALLSAVRDLLKGKEGADEFFQGGSPCLSAEDLSQSLSDEPSFRIAANAVLPQEREMGQFIGPYRLLERIGAGGGGVVFLAEQVKPVRRKVALKVLRMGTDTASVIARFEAERQVLAMMEHVHIAQVLDAGATEENLPYFVMELVHGISITEYCDANRMDIPARLKLFIQVCHAIQHAHHKGVIHRDIKPSNILITEQDGAPVPKVIDFGVAKAIDNPVASERTIQTLNDQFIGTPAYMSPEQAGLGGADVDVRSDIYSLGVLLYTLVSGRPPFTRQELCEAGLEEMLRTLREREPLRPSSRLKSLEDDVLSEIAQSRRLDPRRLGALLDGDLDWIAMKALEKDRERRYQTVAGLAEDVQHYLNQEPVTARPPSRGYRFGKLVRRNKIVFASVTAVVLALMAGFGTSFVLYLKQREILKEQVRLLEESDTREKITQAAVLLRKEEYARADQLMATCPVPVIKPSIEAAGVFRDLGNWNVSQGRWPEAKDRFQKLIEANKVDKGDVSEDVSRDLLYLAPVLVLLEDLDAYGQLVQATLERFAGTRDPVAAEQVIKISLIRPLDDTFKEALHPLVDVVHSSIYEVSDETTPYEVLLQAWRTFALTGLEYRLGHYDEAVSWGNRCLAYKDASRTRIAMTHLILAMAHHQLGHLDFAHTELELGRAAVEAVFPDGTLCAIPDYGGRQSGRWYDWVNAYLLMKEAESLLD